MSEEREEENPSQTLCTKIHSAAMTDPQLMNNNNTNNTNNNSNNNNNNNNNNTNTYNNNINTSTNNNNDGEPKYLHKKFKKMATTEMVAPAKEKKENSVIINTINTIITSTTTTTTTSPAINIIKPINNEIVKKRENIRDTILDNKESSKVEKSTSDHDVVEPTETRKTGYVCPYCKLSCAKPSVLQKHIRAHTNERPYPCIPCGFAFKTKSNLYKHCRSRAHALKMEGGDGCGKVSEDSDISLSDSASNGTGTPPPPVPSSLTLISSSSSSSSSTSSTINLSSNTKTVKTGKIYKPKFHTDLQCMNNDNETTSTSIASNSLSNNSTINSNSSSSNNNNTSNNNNKPNVEKLQEHIDKIITDNQAIVDAVDPRLHKLMQRQQSLIEHTKSCNEQPLNLSSVEETISRKRCYSESFTQETDNKQQTTDGSIIKDLLLKNRGLSNTNEATSDDMNFICQSCKIAYTTADNLEAHRRYYCKGPPLSSPNRDFQLDLDNRRDDCEKSVDYYNTVQPLPSPGPLLGNTRLVDTYAPQIKKSRSESVPTTLRSLEELSKYPRPNSLQMFGGEVRILDNTGETKTMRIEPRQTNSPSNDHGIINPKCATSETSSIVVRSGLHSGGTMVHKPPGTPVVSTVPSTSSISLPNTPKMLAPQIIPNISTPNLAPTMSCYNYLESHLNPLTSITAYNPLTLPQAGITNILHGGKVIPYVPGMPGPHTLSGTTAIDISHVQSTGNVGYKVIPGIPGLHIISQPLNLANPVVQTSNNPSTINESANVELNNLGQSLDSAGSIKETIYGNGCKNTNGLLSPKIQRCLSTNSSSPPINEIASVESEPHHVNQSNYKIMNSQKEQFYGKSSTKFEKNYHQLMHPNDGGSGRSISPMMTMESRKRSGNWCDVNENRNHVARYDSTPPPSSPSSSHTSSAPSSPSSHQDINRVQMSPDDNRHLDIYSNSKINGRLQSDCTPVIIMNMDSSKSDTISNLSYDKLESKVLNNSEIIETNTKFLRPTSLPLKPGTFTPKRHHGITPTANTLPLISPETPRPKKSYGQLYLNGHAYTYLGLKCSTRVFYCTLNRPQPMYVTQQHGLSMYSNWKICKDAPPDLDMAHYDSRHRPTNYSIAGNSQGAILIHSSYRPTTPLSPDSGLESDTQEKCRRIKIFDGGFESNEDYTYVRGRGRGRYVCEECGIRCKKPSMLKKHIRTHTDVRPYTCKHCAFSFKTKGNLTKHMKSKAHYKKCVQLGITPVPTSVCDENIDKDAIAKLVAGGGNAEESSEEEDDSDGDESEESGSEEHEAAQSLLSLSQQNKKIIPGLFSSIRPSTYPYALTFPTTSVTTSIVATIAAAATVASTCVTTTTTVIQNEVPHRYYFPSSRSSTEDNGRDSVIRSSKIQESNLQMEHDGYDDSRHHQQLSQPIDLTTKTPSSLSTSLIAPNSTVIHRSMVTDILTPVSEPVLMQTIVQTMDRLPLQGREWKPDADGQMLQAYLTERHVMDSKIKQQYRVGSFKLDKKLSTSCKTDNNSLHEVFSSSTPTVTYTDPSKMHQMIGMMRDKSKNDLKLEIRNDSRTFDIESHHHNERDNTNLRLSNFIGTGCIDHQSIIRNNKSPMDKSNYLMEINNRESPKGLLKSECNELSADNDMMMNANEFRANTILSDSTRIQNSILPNRDTTIMSSVYDRPPSQEFKIPCQELLPINKESKEHIGNFEVKSPNGTESRIDYKPEQRNQVLIDIQPIEQQKFHELSRAVTGNTKCSERPDIKINNVDITKQGIAENIKHNVARKMVVGGPGFRSSSPSGRMKPQAEFLQPTNGCTPNYISVNEDGRSVCGICNKIFSKPSQLRLHINIHYFERPFRCESCAVSFRTKGHLTKHERSVSHHNKVSMTSTFGAATTSNPRPFKCTDCKIAFRIHGHLAKHLRSKMHIMKLECLGKLPFGTYAEMERSGINLNDIDTTDCDNSLNSLQLLAQKLYEKDPSKMSQWDAETVPQHGTSGGETSSDEGEPLPTNSMHQYPPRLPPDVEVGTRAYHTPALMIDNNDNATAKSASDSYVPKTHFDENYLPYKCQICPRSLRTVNELKVHCFVEHNIDGREKENMQKRIAQEVLSVGTSRDDQDRQKNHKNDDI
ncbi:hypothetical protein PV325_004189 [Microctonus aethiopoides]|nr:hypothetical protein PV325_004189 [Microctonus aethiopoides]